MRAYVLDTTKKQPSRSRVVIVASLLLLLLSAIVSGQAPRNDSRLLGEWTCQSATIDGRPLAGETASVLRLTMTADRFKTQRAAQVLFDSTYKTDASKDPALIEMIGTEGDLKDKPALGIYKLDGDALTMCYVMPGKERPKAFDSQPNSGAFLILWKRAHQ